MKNFVVIATLATLFFGQTAIAQETNADIYTCNFKGTNNQILPKKILLARSDADGSFKAADPIVRYFTGDDANASVIRENDKILSLKWSYTYINRKGIQATVLVNFSLQKKKNKAQITSTVPGYADHGNARGTCALTRGNV